MMILEATEHGAMAEDGPPIDLTHYELVFADEFDKLDASSTGPGTKWTAHQPWGGEARRGSPVPARPDRFWYITGS